MSKGRLRIGVFAYSLLAVGAISVNSAMNVMAEYFHVSDTTISLLASIPCIVIIFATLFLGVILKHVSQKKVGLVGAILFLIGGFLPLFLDNLTLIFVCRGITGIGIAISQVLMATLPAEFFEPFERPAVQGLATAAQSAGMIIMCIGSGLLAAYGWRMSFLVHGIGFFALLAAILCIPEVKPQPVVRTEKAPKARLTKATYGWFALMFFVFLILLVLANNLAFLMEEKGIGDAANTGIALGIYALAGLLVGLIYGKIDQHIKAMKLPLSMLIFGIGFLLVILAENLVVLYLGCFVAGAALSIFFPQIILYTGMSVEESVVPIAISLLTCSQNLGQILCPYAINTLSELIAPPEHVQLYKYIIALIGFGILTIITLIYALRSKRNHSY